MLIRSVRKKVSPENGHKKDLAKKSVLSRWRRVDNKVYDIEKLHKVLQQNECRT